MTEQTAVATANPKPPVQVGGVLAALAPQNIEEAFRLAQALARAGDMVPKHFQDKPDMIMAAIVRGMEIGLAPMQALSNIAVINGRASVWGDALPALMQRAGHSIDCVVTGDGDDMVATATLIRGDTGQVIVRSFSAKDAKMAGLWGKQGPWQQYKSRMLSMRARTLACRDGAADALMGLQVAEEVQDYPRDVTPREPASPLQRKIAAARGATVATAAADAGIPEPDLPEYPLTSGAMGDVPFKKSDSEIYRYEPSNSLFGDKTPDAAVHWTDEDPGAGFPGSAEYDAGVMAFQSGQPARSCPYDDGTGEAADWLGGWYGAKGAAE